MAKQTKGICAPDNAQRVPANLAGTNSVPGVITVDASKWAKWRAACEKANAAAKEEKALRAVCGLPDTAELVRVFKPNKQDGASAVVQNGNGVPVGKVSVYWFPGATIDPDWRARYS